MTLGEKIKQFRKDHLLTLRAAAKLFGVSQAEITRLESQKNEPHFITIAKWNEILKNAERELK